MSVEETDEDIPFGGSIPEEENTSGRSAIEEGNSCRDNRPEARSPAKSSEEEAAPCDGSEGLGELPSGENWSEVEFPSRESGAEVEFPCRGSESYEPVTSIREESLLSFQNLPEDVLAVIFKYITFSLAMDFRTLSSSLHQAVVRKFTTGFRSLLPKISKIMFTIEEQMINLLHQMNTDEDGDEFILLFKKYSYHKVLYAEANVLNAICYRYVEEGVWNYISAYGSRLLDHFSTLMKHHASDEADETLDPSLTSELLKATARFIEHFNLYIEPNLDRKFPFELQFVEIMDCAQDNSFTSILAEWDAGYLIHSKYAMEGVNLMSFPRKIFDDIILEDKLECVLKNMTANVRYSNYVKPLKDEWLMEGLLVHSGFTELKRLLSEPRHFHRTAEGVEEPCYRHHYSRQWRKYNSICKIADEVYRRACHADSCTIDVEITMEGEGRPLALSQGFNDVDDYGLTLFDLHLYVQCPSRDADSICETCIRISSENCVYAFKSHDHHVREMN